MGEQTAPFDQEDRRDFIASQFQNYKKTNEEILNVIRRIWGLKQAGHDFLTAMWPLFDALRTVTEFLGQLPEISAESAEKAWSELHEAPPDILDNESFDQFRYIIEMGFRTALKEGVNSDGSDIKQRIERIFAMILRMIQLELNRVNGLQEV